MSNSVSASWANAHSNRHDWAHNATMRFHSRLSTDVRQRLVGGDQKEEAYIVVFGRTQVGKTTLILDLMGVADTAMTRVSNVLRGGRSAGQSATATAMEYARSANSCWTLVDEDGPRIFENDKAMTEALGELRERMEIGALVCTKPCKVAIPSDCFVESQQPDVRMLDLPGAAASGRQERQHVAMMARQYVPHADLVLLVGRGDGLDFLKPEALDLPGIEDWQLVPARFRVVTTFSFTSQSVREIVRRSAGALNEASIRERLIEQIEKAVPLRGSARRADRYFPMEFGDSWRSLEQEDPAFHRDAGRVIQSLRTQLISDIRASTTPLARIRNAVMAHEVVTRVKEVRQAEMLHQRAAWQAKLAGCDADVAQLRIAYKSSARALSHLRSRLEQLNCVADEAGLGIPQGVTAFPYVKSLIPACKPRRSVGDFIALIAMTKRALLASVVKNRPHEIEDSRTLAADDAAVVRAFWRGIPDIPSTETHRRIVTESFSSLEAKLRSYKTDTYWLPGNHQKDIDSLMVAESNARMSLAGLWRAQWLSAAADARGKLEKDRSQLESSVLLWKDKIRSAVIESSQIRLHLRNIDRDHSRLQRHLDDDLVESQRFRQMLDEAYLDELRARRSELATQRDPARRFMAVLSALQLPYARQELDRATERDTDAA